MPVLLLIYYNYEFHNKLLPLSAFCTDQFMKGHKQCTYKVTLRRVQLTIVPVEKLYYIF